MNRLPNAGSAVVEDRKVRDYLLNPDNVQNSGKSGLFGSFGFERIYWHVLQAALHGHATENFVVASNQSPHGTKYVVQCSLRTPDGRDPCIRSVWIVDRGHTQPRLVTAF